jgi:hypothetical protein
MQQARLAIHANCVVKNATAQRAVRSSAITFRDLSKNAEPRRERRLHFDDVVSDGGCPSYAIVEPA